MDKRENRIWKRIVRRVKASRGSAYFEFCVFVPILLWGFLFAADFTRVLYAEQQVEIASRILADIECHLKPGARDKNGKVGSGCPGGIGKQVVRKYLSEALKNEGIYTYKALTENAVYCKGTYKHQEGLLHSIVDEVLKKILGETPTGSKFFDLLAKIFGGIVEVVTLGTYHYLMDIFPSDKYVRTSVTVMVTPLLPGSPYSLFGKHDSEGVMMIPAVAPRLGAGVAWYDRPLVDGQRVRYYCYMPSLDTVPLAPYTFVRTLSKIFGRWIGD